MVLRVMRWLWWRWKDFVHVLNTLIGFFLMTVVYVVAMAPVALGFKIFRPDPTDRGLGEPGRASYWMDVQLESQDIRSAQRPW